MPRKVLNVAEKPSIAKEVSNILAAGGRLDKRNGHSKFNHVWCFDTAACGPEGRAEAASMRVTSVLGHLMESDFEGEYKHWSPSTTHMLFTAPIVKRVRGTFAPLKRTLVEEARWAQWLVLWLDCDREGENIAFEVAEVCKAANPRLNVFRAHFSALIPRDIFAAAASLGRPNPHLSDAVDARSEIDLRLGAAWTRFQTLSWQKLFPSVRDAKLVLSYGPCQFPTLGFVVERYLEILHFVSEPFWHIDLLYSGAAAAAAAAGGTSPVKPKPQPPGSRTAADGTAFTWQRERLFDLGVAATLYELCVEAGVATVESVDGSPKSRWRPLPLATVELQKKASRLLRMPSEKTMGIAESLYQKGFISYPRTETEVFKDGTDLHGLIRVQCPHPEWGGYARGLVEGGGFRPPRVGTKDDKAHPPIHPTKSGAGLTGDDKRLYDLIARLFLAACSDDARGFGTTVTAVMATERFTASGLMVTERNFLDVLPWEKWSDKEVPPLEPGDTFVPAALLLKKGDTKPPPLLSEADLISLMDDNGIGTDATIAEHIATIQKRMYAQKVQDSRFAPTRLGVALISCYTALNIPLGKPYLRAAMEQDCKAICDGTRSKNDVVRACIAQMQNVFEKCKRQLADLTRVVAHHMNGGGDGGDGGDGGGGGGGQGGGGGGGGDFADVLVPAGAEPPPEDAGVGGRFLRPATPPPKTNRRKGRGGAARGGGGRGRGRGRRGRA